MRALRARPFALLWSGQTVSRFGDAVHAIALAWLVLQLTGSAAAMGIVLAARTLPLLLFSLAGGVAVDRLPRLQVMFAADLVRMAIVATIAAFLVADALELWHLVVLVALFGIVEAFFYPAYVAVLPELVAVEYRPSANGLGQLSRRLARIVGPAAGAALVAAGSTAAAFAIDALTFGISAILILLAARAAQPTRAVASERPRLPAGVRATPLGQSPPIAPPAAMSRASALTDVREGLVTVATEPWIWITIVMAAVTGITLAGPLEAGLPLLVVRHLGGGIGVLGLIETLIAIGAIGATIIQGSRIRLRRRGLLLYGGWIALALAVAAAGLPIGVAGVAIAGLVVGAGGATVGLVWTNAIQDLVPVDRLGRVASIDALGSSALEPIGFVAAGAAADLVGPAAVFLGGGLLSAGILSLALLQPSIRRLD